MVPEWWAWILLAVFLAAVVAIVVSVIVMAISEDRAIARLVEFKRKAREGN